MTTESGRLVQQDVEEENRPGRESVTILPLSLVELSVRETVHRLSLVTNSLAQVGILDLQYRTFKCTDLFYINRGEFRISIFILSGIWYFRLFLVNFKQK